MENNEKLCEMLIANIAKDTQRHVAELKFLEDEIKTLIGAIRTAPDLESLGVVANDVVERLRKRSLESEKARLQESIGPDSTMPRKT